jgi:hypothetical protein
VKRANLQPPCWRHDQAPPTSHPAPRKCPARAQALELEEFRALEKEILSSGAGAGAGAAAGPAAAAASGNAPRVVGGGAAAAARQQPPAWAAPRGDGPSPGWGGGGEDDDDGAWGGGGAAGAARPSSASCGPAGSSGPPLDFGDESEWVDAEFSFGQLPQAGAGQTHNGAAAAAASPSQQQAPRAGAGPPPASVAGGAGGGDEAEMAQAFVRSLYQQAAAGRGGARPGSARAAPAAAGRGAQAGGVAAAAAAAGNDGAGGGIDEMSLDEMRERLMELEAAAAGAARERSALLAMRNSLERAAARLETERRAWELQRVRGRLGEARARELAHPWWGRRRRGTLDLCWQAPSHAAALLAAPSRAPRPGALALHLPGRGAGRPRGRQGGRGAAAGA